jgi:hypothetical protein
MNPSATNAIEEDLGKSANAVVKAVEYVICGKEARDRPWDFESSHGAWW